jgi:oligopeptidase A
MSQSDPTPNPLLDTSGLPRYAEIQPGHVAPAVEVLLAEAQAALALATSDDTPADYDALSAVLDVATERLSRAWGAVRQLSAVVDTPELRAAYNESLPAVTEFLTRLGADPGLFAKFEAIASAPGSAALTPPRRRALDNALRDFVLGGAELQGAARERFVQIQEEHSALSQKFSENVLDATDAFSLHVTPEQMLGVPADVLEATRVSSEEALAAGASPLAVHRLSLQFPVYMPVMQYAHDRALREALYTAYATRASEAGPPALDNTPIIEQLLRLRHEEAALLGHANYAQVSLVPKMADSPAHVTGFLRDLATRARPAAQRDLDELGAFAREALSLPDLQAWDIAFAGERLKEQRYAYSEQEVKQYLTEPRVLEGLFHIVQTLFEVRIVPDEAQVWHPSVRFYRIERPARSDTEAPELLAQFYLDPYARPGKRSGAWMDDVRTRWRRPDGTLQTPVAQLVCNFAAPLPGQPALLTHDDLITLFHEFGHGLHHMLTRIDDLGVSGIAGVEWDAVELPSQFMENFCWEWEVLRTLTAHVDTGEPMPRELFDRILAARNFHSGLATLRQVEYGLYDMRLHAEPETAAQPQRVVDEVRSEVAVLHPPAFARALHSFAHIFAGGYSAGYYSYKWAEVLSADAWSAFEESPGGALDVATGRRYREQVLEAGGSRSAMDSFKAFRGREPQIDALLRHQGL